jgi:hypothetical protein
LDDDQKNAVGLEGAAVGFTGLKSGKIAQTPTNFGLA